jgi:hypothetical protein
MKPRRLLVISACLVASVAWGQETPAHQQAPAQQGSPAQQESSANEESSQEPEFSYSEVLNPPLPVSALQMPMAFPSETERSNFFTAGLRFATGYDDNVLATSSNRLSNLSYMIMPSVRIGQVRERWQWDFGYSPGVTINQQLSDQNQSAHYLDTLFTYRLSPHVSVQIKENFEKTSSIFSGVLSNSNTPTPGPLQQPNSSVITPLADRTGNTTVLDLGYQFDANSLVGASGNFYFANYDSPAGSSSTVPQLINSRSWGGNGFYAHRFSNRQWVGITYNFQRLLFDPGNRTDINRPLLFYSISTGTRLTFSAWAGPEQTTSSIPFPQTVVNAPSSQVNWHVAGGADLLLKGKQTNFRMSYTRQTTDGGGLAEAVRLEQVSGVLQRRLTERWMADVGVGYGKNHPLSSVGDQTPYNSLLANAGIDCQLTDSFSFGLRYGREQLTYEFPSSASSLSNRNRAWFSFSYSFSRPLGR